MATAKRNPVFKSEYVKVRSLIGLHEKLKSLIKKLGYVGEYPFPADTTLSRDSIPALLELMPIRVASVGQGRYKVIGGVRQYLLVMHLLGPKDDIGVLVNDGPVNHERMLRQFAVEYATLPILMGCGDKKDVLSRLHQLEQHLPPGILNTGTREELAATLGISLRTLESRAKSTDI